MQVDKVICIGSGKNAVNINDWNTDGITICGVNNTWKASDKIDYLIHSGDYPFKKDIKIKEGAKRFSVDGDTGYRKSYVEMTAAGGNKKLPWQQARIHLGLPIYFTLSYWALYYLKPKHMAFLGFDMNYTPGPNGETTFYGKGYDMQKRGEPDPLFQFKRHYKNLENPMKTLLERLDIRRENTQFYNLSTDPDTVLPWNKISIEEFKNL